MRVLLLVALAALLGGFALADPLPGATLSSAILEKTDQQPVTWKPGRVTVLSFFAFWCNTWKQQCPRLHKTREALAGMPIDVLTISVDGRWSDVPGFDPTLGCMLDRVGWASSIGVDKVPTTLIVDATGRIRWVKAGVARTEDMILEAKAALKPEPGGSVRLRLERFPAGEPGKDLLRTLVRLNVKAEIEMEAPDPSVEREAWTVGEKPVSGPAKGKIVDPADETRPGVLEIVRRVSQRVEPGSTVVLHCDVSQTVEALPLVVAALRRGGFEVVL